MIPLNRMFRLGFGLTILSRLILPTQGAAAEPDSGSVSIIQHGFGDLNHGSFGDSGANLYVSAKGRIQTIHRWDLNHDGELDLFFTNDHNHNWGPDAMIYWGGANGPESLLPELPELRAAYTLVKHAEQARKGITWLPALGGGRCQIADLNGDGYPDILFGNVMDGYRVDVPAYVYWGSAGGFKESDRTVLPGYAVSGVAVGDLNGDGLPEIVLANRGGSAGVDARFHSAPSRIGSYIYWGEINGFPRTQIPDVARRTTVPTINAEDVAIGDFNGDKRSDLAFVNNSPQERSIYVYWGDGTGTFGEASRQVLPVADPASAATRRDIEMHTLLAMDLDRDGCDDLVVAGKCNAIIFSGSALGLKAERWTDLPAAGCYGLEAADLNGDGQLDLVLANDGNRISGRAGSQRTPSVIYWGAARGFSPDRRTDLPTLWAKTVKAADINQDGFTDLLFGNSSGLSDVSSHIYWGGPNGIVAYRRKELLSFGVVGAGIADLNRDGKPDIVLVNHTSGFGNEPTVEGKDGKPDTIPEESSIGSLIYWGNRDHHYSSASVYVLKPGGEYMHSIADLDDDGFADIIVNERLGGSYIWWGSQSGYRLENRTKLRMVSTPVLPMGHQAADLNRDGYLDVVFTVTALADTKDKLKAIIVYGNGDRFKAARTDEFPLSASAASLSIADMNKDGYLDLIFPMADIGYSEIWWGSARGFAAKNISKIESAASAAVVADLDRDGRLDLIMTGVLASKEPVAGGPGIPGRSRNSDTYIYWGSQEGFKTRTAVESFTCLDATVTDFNRDGHLDIALTNYQSDTTRELPAAIYWGDGGRGFSNKRRTLLDAASSAAIDALDLNRDGWPDLVISDHQKNFSHSSGTNIYWGGAKGFSLSNRTNLPTMGVHFDAFVDAGNIYDRKYEWDYLSSDIEAPKGRAFARLRWKAETELGTGVKFQVRSAAAREELAIAKWSGPNGEGSFYLQSDADLVGVKPMDRWLQYRAVLVSPDGGNSPLLSEVEIVCAGKGVAK